jgi:hypothetical protein
MHGRSLQMWVWGSAFGSFVVALAILALTPVRHIARSWFYGMSSSFFALIALGMAGVLVLQLGAMLVVAGSDNFANRGWQSGLKGMLRYLILSSRVERLRGGNHPGHYYRTNPEDYAGAVPWSGLGSGSLSAAAVMFVWFATVAVPGELATLASMFTAWERLGAGGAARSVAPASTSGTSLASVVAPLGAAGASDLGYDAFGHPIAREQAQGRNDVRLRSFGVDQQPSDDDLCVTSVWQPHVAAGTVDAAQFSQAVKAERLTLAESFEAIRKAKCWSNF